MDTYDNFKILELHESEFDIEFCDRRSAITIMAPHGGRIEPHTSEIARLIAGDSYNCYCFNGTKSENNQVLHLASHRYDEPQAIALAKKSRTVITVHGCREKRAIIHIGGLDRKLGKKIERCFQERTIPCRLCPRDSPFGGTSLSNICNLGSNGKGVQLEISRELRDSVDAWKSIARAVRKALELSDID